MRKILGSSGRNGGDGSCLCLHVCQRAYTHIRMCMYLKSTDACADYTLCVPLLHMYDSTGKERSGPYRSLRLVTVALVHASSTHTKHTTTTVTEKREGVQVVSIPSSLSCVLYAPWQAPLGSVPSDTCIKPNAWRKVLTFATEYACATLV
jgi:hypothetical protein